MANAQAYAGVARAPFLLLPATLVAAGAAAAAWDGAFSWPATLLALVALVALHIAVNALNEASDMKSGIDLQTTRTPFSGGSGTIQTGAIDVRSTVVFAFLCAAVGGAIGVWFLLRIGLGFLPIMVLGAVTVLAYTDFFARAGIGELAAGLGLGALPVMGAAMVQDNGLGHAAIAAAVPAFFMTFNLLLLNEFPDEVADRQGGRRNLVLIVGRPAAAKIYAAAAIATPLSIVASVVLRALPPLALIAVLPSILLVKPVGWALSSPEEPMPPIPALGSNVIWNLSTNALMAVGLVIALRFGLGR
jgi:1,4-dihydroxy-2-naphthoate polyprenyltransferase